MRPEAYRRDESGSGTGKWTGKQIGFNHSYTAPPPTDHLPGTAEKIAEMACRAEQYRNLPDWWPDEVPLFQGRQIDKLGSSQMDVWPFILGLAFYTGWLWGRQPWRRQITMTQTDFAQLQQSQAVLSRIANSQDYPETRIN